MVLCFNQNEADLFLFAASDSGSRDYSDRNVPAEAAPNLSDILGVPDLSIYQGHGRMHRL